MSRDSLPGIKACVFDAYSAVSSQVGAMPVRNLSHCLVGAGEQRREQIVGSDLEHERGT
jgi:hypothetical protein